MMFAEIVGLAGIIAAGTLYQYRLVRQAEERQRVLDALASEYLVERGAVPAPLLHERITARVSAPIPAGVARLGSVKAEVDTRPSSTRRGSVDGQDDGHDEDRIGPVDPTAGAIVDAARPLTHGDEGGRQVPFTPDTAPAGLATIRQRWITPAVLVVYASVAVGLHPTMDAVTSAYRTIIERTSGVPSGDLAFQLSFAIRPLLFLYLIALISFMPGSRIARAMFAVRALGLMLVLVIAVDTTLARATLVGGPSPFAIVGNSLAGVAGLAAIGITLLKSLQLPPPVVVRTRRPRSRHFTFRFLVSICVSAVIVYLVFESAREPLERLSDVPLLGGALSPWLLMFIALPTILAAIAAADRPPSEGSSWPSVRILIPAHNEAAVIRDTISALDVAVGHYPGVCHVYVIENGSTDGTHETAERHLRRCTYLSGSVLSAPPVGKARALNIGLQHANEDVVLRVDADTLLSPLALRRMMRHFSDPSVGGVGGVPLPKQRTSWIERMRAIEVLYGVRFKRFGQTAVDAVTVLPGMTVAFRRELLWEVRGFAEGINGEDADVTVRIGRLGYRMVSDPRVEVYTEVPVTLRGLREQRMRWARGLFHMVARNGSAIWMHQGVRGVWQIPWACLVMFRKLVFVPVALVALGLIVIHGSLFPLREVAAAGAILLGMQLIQMSVVLLVSGELSLLPHLPGYLVFRLVLAYIALDMLLTLPLAAGAKSRWRFRPPPGTRRHGDAGAGGDIPSSDSGETDTSSVPVLEPVANPDGVSRAGDMDGPSRRPATGTSVPAAVAEPGRSEGLRRWLLPILLVAVGLVVARACARGGRRAKPRRISP